jgi:hypothetical protein
MAGNSFPFNFGLQIVFITMLFAGSSCTPKSSATPRQYALFDSLQHVMHSFPSASYPLFADTVLDEENLAFFEGFRTVSLDEMAYRYSLNDTAAIESVIRLMSIQCSIQSASLLIDKGMSEINAESERIMKESRAMLDSNPFFKDVDSAELADLVEKYKDKLGDSTKYLK